MFCFVLFFGFLCPPVPSKYPVLVQSFTRNFLRDLQKEGAIRALRFQLAVVHMKPRINQHLLSMERIYREHLQLAGVQRVQPFRTMQELLPCMLCPKQKLLPVSTDTIAHTFLLDTESQMTSITLKPNTH